MRRPKHRRVRRGRDEEVHDYSSHAPHDAFVRISVSELESATNGMLIVDLERVSGPVAVRWTDENGKLQELLFSHKEGGVMNPKKFRITFHARRAGALGIIHGPHILTVEAADREQAKLMVYEHGWDHITFNRIEEVA